jgi:hypothetical protein
VAGADVRCVFADQILDVQLLRERERAVGAFACDGNAQEPLEVSAVVDWEALAEVSHETGSK